MLKDAHAKTTKELEIFSTAKTDRIIDEDFDLVDTPINGNFY